MVLRSTIRGNWVKNIDRKALEILEESEKMKVDLCEEVK